MSQGWEQKRAESPVAPVDSGTWSDDGVENRQRHKALQVREKSMCRRSTAGTAGCTPTTGIMCSSIVIPRLPGSRRLREAPRLSTPLFGIDQVFIRSTPPRWRVAAQLAGASRWIS